MDIGPGELLIAVVVLLLFGPSRLPSLARGLGSAVHEFRRGLTGGDDDEDEPRTDDKR